MKNRVAWLFIGVVVVVPLALYLTLEHGIPKTLNVFGKGPLPNFVLKDQLGRTLTQKELEGKIVVADFFFASCTSICPKMSVNMARAQERFSKYKDKVLFLSISVDPERDTVEVLSDYGRRYSADPKRWLLATGDRKQIYDLAAAFLLGVAEAGDGQFIHSDYWVLVDTKRRIRGYYRGTEAASVKEILRDIKNLDREKSPSS